MELMMAITDDIKTLQKKSLAGDAKAQCELGIMLTMGAKVPMDLKKAVEQLRLAAHQGGVIAQYQLSILLNQEPKLALDEQEAFRWCQYAAAQGYEDAKKRILILENILSIKRNIHTILDNLDQKNAEIKLSESSESYTIITKLFHQLKKATEDYIDKLTCDVPFWEAQNQFEIACNSAISPLIKGLDRNSGWGLYLTDMLKKLMSQTLSVGKNSNFFVSDQGKLAKDLESSQQPDQHLPPNLPPSY